MSDDVEVYVRHVSVPDAGYQSWRLFADSMFAECDMKVRSRSKTHPIVRQVCDLYDFEPRQSYSYLLAPASVVRKRLLIQGYTPEFCVRVWENARMSELALLRQFSGDEKTDAEIAQLQCLTFSDWLSMIRSEVEQFPRRTEADVGRRWKFKSLLSAQNDVFVQICCLIEALPDAPVWMDCGYLYENGDDERTPQQIARDEDAEFENDLSGAIIILTEGKSDTRIISAALRAFYPEYAEAYQFLDFEEFKIEGGATLLAKMIKVLSGARVKNRMIGLFDNDAAGLEAHRPLNAVRFPNNVRIMRLPDTKLAKSYPTLGPAGLAKMDVNGSGAPIELYLGRNNLKGPDGKLRPIRWTQWIDSVSRYQGVVQDKDAVSKAFFEALNGAMTPASLRRTFPEMDLLLRTIFAAFEDHQPPMI